MLCTLASFFNGVDAVADELVDDVVDKVGERGVAIGIVGVTDTELVLWMGVATVAALTADAAAAKAAAAIKAELCKKGDEKIE